MSLTDAARAARDKALIGAEEFLANHGVCKPSLRYAALASGNVTNENDLQGPLGHDEIMERAGRGRYGLDRFAGGFSHSGCQG